MGRFGLLGLAGLLGMLCGTATGQQFHISSFTNGEVVIEYPPSFAGAYLFVESASNLTSNVVWEAVDYSQVELVEGDMVYYTPPATNAPGSTNQTTEVPYVITPEYIQAVSSGEIQNDSWTAGTAWGSPMDGLANFYMISAISYVDTDGDGVDNVSEYGAGTDPYTSDSPPANLPPDDGDPKPVPGSVNSAPGDWNSPPQSNYRAFVGLYGAINARILAMDGTNGTFTADSTVVELGTWIESMCGMWTASATNDLYPTVDGGRFYRTETNGFTWVGKENIYPLAFHPYDGSEEFANHLVRADIADSAGLAVLPDSTPVLVNASNPWTKEKIEACLPHLVTVGCRLQKVEAGTYDPSDTTAMAQGLRSGPYGDAPTDEIGPCSFGINDVYYNMDAYGAWLPGFLVFGGLLSGENYFLTFFDNLSAYGFGETVHRGFVSILPEGEWHVAGSQWMRTNVHQSVLPSGIVPNEMYRSFTCQTGDSAWLFAGETNFADHLETVFDDPPPYHPPNTGWVEGVGYTDSGSEVLSTFSPPPEAEPATLAMDFDRDGRMTVAEDWDRFDKTHPFRFWVNEDGNAAAYPEADLEDFFPAQIHWRDGVGMSNLTFKLSANVDLNYIQTTMTTNDTDAYLTDLTVAGTLPSGGSIPSLSAGVQTTETFNENDIVLLAAAEANTNAQIYVHILENGSEILVSTNHFSFSPVAAMYRTKNFRTGGTSTTDEPANWPNELTNGKDFVFIHGYRVTEEAGHEWNKAFFKHLWHSGSNARYHAVLWDGTPPGFLGQYHYHNAVVNAFATAPDFAAYLNGLNEPVVTAHSLGNMVASEAITGGHGLDAYDVKQFYMLNAAVAKEAYGDSAPNEDMIPDGSLVHNQNEGIFSFVGHNWQDYPFETYASEWYCLFTNEVDDARAELTWRHRFADIQDKTDAFNFHSSTEEVLRVDTGYTSLFSGPFDWDIWNATERFGLYTFQLQELFKGKDGFGPGLADAAGGSDPYTGWGFTTESDTHIISTPKLDIDLWPRNPSYHRTQLGTNDILQRFVFREILKIDPLFRPEPSYLFGAGGSAFAAGTVGYNGGTLNYNTDNAPVPIDDVKITDWLLAKAFPARTGALGSRPMGDVGGGWGDATIDIAVEYIKPGQWIRTDTYNGTLEWRHNDINDVPYVYVHKFFDKLTAKEETP